MPPPTPMQDPFPIELEECERLDRTRIANFADYNHYGFRKSAGHVAQHSNAQGVFAEPPTLHLIALQGITRKDWERLKAIVDRAFDAFEGKWPSP
jgi:hypothetical protein